MHVHLIAALTLLLLSTAAPVAVGVAQSAPATPPSTVLVPDTPPPVAAPVASDAEQPLIQLAILLDTSNSMDGLIDQARSQLWKIVNDFVTASRSGKKPLLQVALYEYGNSNLSRASHYLRLVVPLTSDLDRVSEELFALRTRGGEEFCGAVITHAVANLEWSPNPDDLKVIYIAGNEPFTQGPTDFRTAVRQSIARGITVNTIHCGDAQEGIRGNWQEAALLADGAFLNIDQNRQVAHIAAPQDDEIARLGRELNRTYLAYGGEGKKARARQADQDQLAGAAGGGSAVHRSIFKGRKAYKNPHWDLVDAEEEGTVAVEAVPAEALPAEMQAMTKAERKAHVAKMRAERERIRQRLAELEADRKAHVARAQRAATAAPGAPKTFDQAVGESLRVQAQKKGFVLAE